eukprot:c20982_g1_i1 orf=206-409(+)
MLCKGIRTFEPRGMQCLALCCGVWQKCRQSELLQRDLHLCNFEDAPGHTPFDWCRLPIGPAHQSKNI